METVDITRAHQVPKHLQRAAKVALCIGADVRMSADQESLLAQLMPGNDLYYFNPEDVTLHCLEVLGLARQIGFIMYRTKDSVHLQGRTSLVVRTIFCSTDVRVQIGASKWFAVEHTNTAIAMRRAIVDGFCAYYDEQIAPYPEA